MSLAINVKEIKAKLSRYLRTKSIPDRVAEVMAALEDSTDLLKCIPRIKSGNCYKSSKCRIPKIKHDVSIILSICKRPWLIKIDFVDFKIPRFVKLKIQPLVIRFQHYSRDAYFTIKSDTTAKLTAKYVNVNVAKARFIVDGAIRYDCTKPRGTGNWIKRSKYNINAPNRQYNAMFYRLKIRLELKKKNFRWLKFNYKCVRCEDLVNKKGIFGSGPKSCVAETNRYIAMMEEIRHKRRCHGKRRCHRP